MSRRTPPDSVEDALRRAATHARNALAETIAACRALLDAVSLVTARGPAEERVGFATLAGLLDELEGRIGRHETASQEFTAPLVAALAESLDAEIARWERRAARDPDARAVLRAFLGLRELLWELGVRTDAARDDEGGPDDHPLEPRAATGPAPRVQRIRVNG
jgi:hypothetical protein